MNTQSVFGSQSTKEGMIMRRRQKEGYSNLNFLYVAMFITVLFTLLNVIATVNGMSPFDALNN